MYSFDGGHKIPPSLTQRQTQQRHFLACFSVMAAESTLPCSEGPERSTSHGAALLAWATEVNADTALPCSVQVEQDTAGGWELLLSADASRLEPVLSIPFERLFTPAAAWRSLQAAGFMRTPDQESHLLIAGLAVERRLGAASAWHPYISALPSGLPGLAWCVNLVVCGNRLHPRIVPATTRAGT